LLEYRITKDTWSSVSSGHLPTPHPTSPPRAKTKAGALDSGAHGVLVPLLYTVEDAKKLVLSAKFPPQGQRGFGSPFPQERFHPDLDSTGYLQQANDAILTMVQIETKSALDNVEAIAAVPGIDVLFVGPFDLGNNIGHPIINGEMHESLHAAIAKTLKAANAAGKKAGIFCTSGEQSRKYAEDGFHMISVATDILVLQASVMDAVSTAKGLGPAPKLTGPYGK
jgi:4-hydroxy-2-oxoheptanedioate aldolase